jgi:branched-subunit amino acid aminotransferase/4-amino-4-deoxychorismate lyase
MSELYETLLANQNLVFNYAAHYNRLKKSAKKFNLQTLPSQTTLLEQIKSKLKNQTTESRVRIDLTKNSCQVSIKPIISASSSKLITINQVRPNPTTKNSDRKIEDQALYEAQQNDCLDAIFTSSSQILKEGSITNIFFVRDNHLFTAKSGVLPGTTRKIVLQIAKKLEIPTNFKSIKVNQLDQVQEIFVTNSIKGIVPITQINRYKLAKNPITTILLKEFQAYRQDQNNWH